MRDLGSAAAERLLFLFDVDSTLLDNDHRARDIAGIRAR